MRIGDWCSGSIAALLLVALLWLVCFRPARIIGSSGERLAHSLRRAVHGPETGSCTEVGGRWRCHVLGANPFEDDVAGPSRTYLVELGDWGCWEAQMVDGKSGDHFPQTLDGCIAIGDLI